MVGVVVALEPRRAVLDAEIAGPGVIEERRLAEGVAKAARRQVRHRLQIAGQQ